MEVNLPVVSKTESKHFQNVYSVPAISGNEEKLKTIPRDRVVVGIPKDPKFDNSIRLYPSACETQPDSIEKNINEIFDDPATLSVTSKVLSLVPGSDVVKLSVNVLSTSARHEKFKEESEKNDRYGKYSNGTNMVKNAWSTVVSGTKVADLVVSEAHALNLVSKTKVDRIAITNAKINRVASTVALPFSVAETTLYGWSMVREKRTLEEKEMELMLVKNNKVPKNNCSNTEKELEKEIASIKTNNNYKKATFAFSTVSSVSLAVAATSPRFEGAAATISLVTGIGATVCSALSEEKSRKKIESSIKKNFELINPFKN